MYESGKVCSNTITRWRKLNISPCTLQTQDDMTKLVCDIGKLIISLHRSSGTFFQNLVSLSANLQTNTLIDFFFTSGMQH